MSIDVFDRSAVQGGVFDRCDELGSAGHEFIAFGRDEPTGLRAIISIHDTTLGPALGGTRFFAYGSEAEALKDGLRLSQGMTFKAAAAGLPFGGGKAVIIGDTTVLKTPDLLRAYGRFVDTLGGRYVTAADVGTTSEDLDIIGEATSYVVGRTMAAGGSGDSGFATALGVFCAMQTAADVAWGTDGLVGRLVGIEGAGKVGFHLIGMLRDVGARVVVSDPFTPSLARVRASHGDVATVDSVIQMPLDIYSPCAMGATLTTASVQSLRAAIVCGAANNQLLDTPVGSLLHARGIVWIPDFVANAGGLIQVASERLGKTQENVMAHVQEISTTVSHILDVSRTDDVPTGVAAQRLVLERLNSAAVHDEARV
jgi:valine dehydrogenase (NAD+)